ncbi:MAG TPA: N-acetylmuramoyl-L-alanine amidase [Gammaproteobacteria bacterium]|nr:N-acetylmuramoyl-L-alanine amidase [Gammaproteobacteria bacterium]
MKPVRTIQALCGALLLGATTHSFAATVNSVRVWSGPDSTRVVFELTAPVEHRVSTLADPARVVIDLPDTKAAGPLSLPEPKGVVAAVRAGSRSGGDLRVVLELTKAAKAKSFLLAPNDQYGNRLVVDLVQGGDDSPVVHRAAPETVSASAPAPAVAPSASGHGRDVIVAIDAGHGGDDPGASGRNGTHEKDVVLAIARRVAEELDAQPGMHAVLVRSGDYFVPLRKRIAIAHAAQADFFMSIHADSYRDSSATGATVYVLNEKGATDEAALRLARRENESDLIGGVSLADTDQTLARVLLDLSQNAALSASTAAGQRLIKKMSAVTPMRRTQVQQAPFLVLKSPDIPSVLVETAYISNPREEASLRSPQYQTSLARALREGIVDYFTANPPQGSYFAHTVEPPQRTVHHVARGETLSEIAERYRVSAASLRRSNSLKSDSVHVGQVLTIPPG